MPSASAVRIGRRLEAAEDGPTTGQGQPPLVATAPLGVLTQETIARGNQPPQGHRTSGSLGRSEPTPPLRGPQ